MADSDFSVKAIISAQTSQFEKGMKDAQKSLNEVSKSIQGVSNLLKSAFSVVGIGMSIKAVADFGSSCVKAADSANKSFSILQNTINVTGATAWTSAEKMEQMSIEISDATNYSVGEIQDMQSVLLGFRNITGDTFREASDAITDMATVMGMDLKSAVQTVGKALDDPIKGLDSLKRQGFAFTEQQKQQLEVLVKTGKQMEAQKIILDELSTTYGGAAKAAQSATARWNHAMDSFKESIGNQLMPAVNASTEQMTKMLTKITDFVNSSEFNNIVIAFTNIANKVKTTFSVIREYIDEVFTEIMGIFHKVDFSPFKSVLDTLIGSIGKYIDIIKDKINKSIERFKAIATEIGNVFSNLDLEGISEYINAFIDGFWFIYDEVQEITQEIQDWITEKIIWIWEKIKELFNNSNEALANSESSIKSWGDYFWYILDNVFKIFQDLINLVKAMLNGDWAVAWEYAKLTIARWADHVLTIFSTVANAFPELINGIIGGLNKIIENINKVREWLGDDPIDLLGAFTSVDLSKASGLTKFIEDTEKKIEKLTGKVADVSIRSLKGISTESKGAFEKLKSEITSASNAAEKATKKTKKTYSASLAGMSSESNDFFGKLEQGWMKVREEIEKDAEDWSDVVKASYSSITGAGNEMFTMLGENLAGAGHGYEDFTAVALEGLAQILQSLAAQITALGVTRALMGDYASAAIAAAGAAAALVAAGVATAVASNMKKTSDSVKDVGDAAEKSEGQLEEFMKKLEQIKEGTYGQEAGLTFLGIKKLEAEISNVLKDYNYWIGEYNRRSFQFSEEWDPSNIQKGNLAWVMSAKIEMDKYEKELNILLDKYNSVVSEAIQTQRDLAISNYDTAGSYKSLYDMASQFYQDEIIMSKAGQFKQLLKESLSADISQLVKDAWTSLSSVGKDLGEQFFSSIEEGADSANFLINMKKIIRNNMLKIAVYTQSFNDKMAEIGTKLVSAISGGPKWLLGEAKYELEELYESTLITTKSIDSLLDNVFGKTSESINTATDSLTKFENAMKDLLESIQDLGGDIASNLVDALSNGLTQSDFLGNMKTWLRNMMIQMVVYTDTMKAEVEEIGKRISEGLTSGFTDTSLHEIRRDLSYIFEQTSSKMANLDTILDGVFSGYATGTENARRGIHLVGEAGPELVQFKGGERVFNNRDTMSMIAGGNPSNNFNVTFNNLQDTSAFAMMSQLKQYQREMAFNAVI